ncbi:hypothetical protein ACH5RR_037000 [Cinchona calisaya]|uniref:SWIM-type domain-containing protein n=1 Tax=Cinchona calisaya TaxID=153742 RepID=A0ABD2Y4U9_9GENT
MCRPVLCVDGTHLRGEYRGKLLIAVALDANNQILLVAYAIVDEEIIQSRGWFMEQLRHHVVRDLETVCIISDRHRGIVYAMSESPLWQEPFAYHRFCLRHVQSYLMTKYKNVEVKKLCWSLGVKLQRQKWNKYQQMIQLQHPEVWRYLADIGLDHWCLAHDGNRKWGIHGTNSSESYNNVLHGVRLLSIKAIIDSTFHRCVKLFVDDIARGAHCRTSITPKNWKRLLSADKKGAGHSVMVFDQSAGVYRIKTPRRVTGRGGNVQTVNYVQQTCTCGKWQMYRFPCSHALAVYRHKGDEPTRLLADHYTTRIYRDQYSVSRFVPQSNPDELPPIHWQLRGDDNMLVERRASRVRARRIRNEMDIRDRREPRRCTNYQEPGHNCRSCPSRQQ